MTETIIYSLTFEYGKPDAYNSQDLKTYDCEIGIRLDRFWKLYPEFSSFVDNLILYQMVERICLEVGLMKMKSKYPCTSHRCPMEFPALLMLNKDREIPNIIPIGYKVRKVLKKYFDIRIPLPKKKLDLNRITIKEGIILKNRTVQYLQEKGVGIGDYNNAQGFFERLNDLIRKALDNATQRAMANNRNLVLSFDL
jgi:hypothetical protein